MIEIPTGTLTEKIIRELQKTYPITVSMLKDRLSISEKLLMRELERLQVKGIILLEPLPDRIYIRLLRFDFRFIGRKYQKRFLKKTYPKKPKEKEYDDSIYF
ncbi:MAG TPA: transcriptional regulator [Thermoplasmatales archaeon]|nr:transcriptional regulator [Thermoplasmatales archaeon]